jgi:hypothetical protein
VPQPREWALPRAHASAAVPSYAARIFNNIKAKGDFAYSATYRHLLCAEHIGLKFSAVFEPPFTNDSI